MSSDYRTANLYEASFLMARGCKMIGKSRIGNKVAVIFEDGNKVRAEVVNYYNHGMVAGKAYSDSYRTLKDYVFQND